ncbi:MAG: Peptidoglycan O-acetyltransferase [Syntrophus sp. PtaB.Bin001]|nr:MAG: Peptidoglycan O-acetyltransferase [Syntrophus sp. PtaB.Bin001]
MGFLMIFTQIEFLLFFLLLLGCLSVIRENRYRKIILLAASYYFYAYWNWRFLGLLFVSTFSDYQIGRYLSKLSTPRQRILLIAASLVINLSILFSFKYCNFFVSSLQHLLIPIGIHVGTLSVILPLGISFYTFRTLSYTIDVYRRRIEPCTSLLDYALFVSFFPTMVAGPIVRASDLLPQFMNSVSLSFRTILLGFRSFVIGCFLKVFVADGIATFTDYVFGNVAVFNSLTIWLAAIGYSMQLYCDFAGYSMMAIGVAKAIGYEIPENFNFPYLSKNIAEFWRRWHITLSKWIRDYVYISLGGSRNGNIRTSINILLTMSLCGLWHGAAWTFVFWGLFHGLALVLYHIWTAVKNHTETKGDVQSSLFCGFFCRTATLLTVVVGWVFFRADGFDRALVLFGKMFYPSAGFGWYHPFVLFVLFSFAIIQFAELSQLGAFHRLQLSAWYTPSVIFTMIWLCIVFHPREFTPFIYSKF